jgi:Protein tyrosine/serine phosphatase
MAVAAIADAPEGMVVVHCHSGKDRTGLVVGLVLSALGVPAKVIAADYALSADRLATLHAGELAACEDRQHRAVLCELRSARPETMRATLAYLEHEFGGAAAYLERLGLRRVQLAALSERFVQMPAEVSG